MTKNKANREETLAAVKKDGSALKYADESLKADREIVLAAEQGDEEAQYNLDNYA